MADAKRELDIILDLKDKVTKKIDKVEKGVDGLGGAVNKNSKSLLNWGKILKTVVATGAIAIISKQLFNLGKASLRAAADLEQATISFEVMLGSAEAAVKLIKEINEVAVKTPYEQSAIIKSTQGLLAFGVASEDVLDTFKVIGDIAQGNSQKLETLTRAYGKVQAKGKASMEEINMVAEAGVPIIDELAKVLGVTKEQVFALSAQGKLTRKDFNTAMKSMTLEGGKFFRSMEKQSKTFNGLMSTLSGNLEIIRQEFGKRLLPAGKKFLQVMIKLTEKVVREN